MYYRTTVARFVYIYLQLLYSSMMSFAFIRRIGVSNIFIYNLTNCNVSVQCGIVCNRVLIYVVDTRAELRA